MPTARVYLASAVAWAKTSIVIYTPFAACCVVFVVLLVDTSAWRGHWLCEANRVCSESLNRILLRSECDSFDGALDTLFNMYSVAIPVVATKMSLIFVFWLVQIPKNSPWQLVLRAPTRARAIAGIAFWSMCFALDMPVIVACLYRFVALPLKTQGYADLLYTGSPAAYSPTAAAICLLVALTAGSSINGWMLWRRVKENNMVWPRASDFI